MHLQWQTFTAVGNEVGSDDSNVSGSGNNRREVGKRG